MKKFLLCAAAAVMAVAANAAVSEDDILVTMYPGDGALIGWGNGSTMEVVTEDGREALKFTNPSAVNVWEAQMAYDFDYQPGTTYYFTFDIKGDPFNGISSAFQCTDGYVGCGDLTSFNVTSDWTNVVISGTAQATSDGKTPDRWVINLGQYVGSLYISNMMLYTQTQGGGGDDPELTWKSLINGGVAADGQTSSIQAGWNGDAQVVANPAGEGVVFECPIAENPSNVWDSQMFIVLNEALATGDKIKVSLDYYCSDTRTVETQAQTAMGSYLYWECIGNLDAAPAWKQHVFEGTVKEGQNGMQTIAFNLATAPDAAVFYVNNVVVEKETISTGVVNMNAVDNNRIVVYNLMGVKVLDTDDASMLSTLRKGIYIVNGKKQLVK